jgi:uncharacterized membrane protein HdeD (DUF308 family)
VIAIWALSGGIVRIVHAFELRPVFPQWWVLLLDGLVGVAFAAAAFYYYPALSLTFAVVWTAWWLALSGGLVIYAAIQERQLGLPWGWTMAYGIVAVVTAVLAFVSPPATLAAIMGLIAGFAIVSGVVLLVGAYKLASAKDALAATIRHA